MNDDRLQFWALYLSRFAEGFGFVTLITLLPYYINALDPLETTILGLTVSTGLIYEISMASVFYIGRASALTGAVALLVILVWLHGTRALTAW